MPYPEPWQRRYSDSGYLDIDPTAIHGRRSQTAIVWSDAVFQDAGQMWSEARSFDLKVGIAQSTFGGNGSVSMLTLSRSGTPFTPTELSKNGPYIRWLADLAHGALSGTFLLGTDQDTPSLGLTVREIEILKWMADGKTSNDTAGILNLSVATVNFHMKNAISSRPCKIHRNIQPSDPQRVLRACVAIASAAAQIHSRASRGAKSPLRPKRTIARSSQRML